MRDIAAVDSTLDVTSVLQKLRAHCFDLDLKSVVSSNKTLLDIHSSAEDLGATLEQLYAPFQVCHMYLDNCACCQISC